jgi:hypothetical protein
LVVLVLCLVGVGGCGFVVWNAVGPYVQMELKITQDLGTTQVSSVTFNDVNGQTTWVIHLKPGYGSDAAYAACSIVKRDLATDSKFANDSFEIVDSDGNPLATDFSPCP